MEGSDGQAERGVRPTEPLAVATLRLAARRGVPIVDAALQRLSDPTEFRRGARVRLEVVEPPEAESPTEAEAEPEFYRLYPGRGYDIAWSLGPRRGTHAIIRNVTDTTEEEPMEVQKLAADARRHLTALRDAMRDVSLWDGEIVNAIAAVDSLLLTFEQPTPAADSLAPSYEGALVKAAAAIDAREELKAYQWLELAKLLRP